MAQRLTVADIRNDAKYRIPTTLGICPTDSRLLAWANVADEAMANQGRWWGSIWEAQFCVNSGCLTFPREVATVEQVAICGIPMDYENGWYSYTRQIATLQQCNSCSTTSTSSTCSTRCSCGHLQMREKPSFAVSFATTSGANKVIRTYPT